MFCTNCGKQIDDDAKFCIYCGEKKLDFQLAPAEVEESAVASGGAEGAEAPSLQDGELAGGVVDGVAGGDPVSVVADSVSSAAVVDPVIPAEEPANAEAAYPNQTSPSVVAFKPATVSGQKGARGAKPAGDSVSRKTVCIAVAASFAAAFVLFAVVPRAVGLMGGSGSTASVESQSAQVQQESQSSQEESTSSSDAAAASKQESSSKADDSKKTIEVKSGIAQYSWSELAAIASEIENGAKTRDAALQIAAKYNLVASDGTLTGAKKTLQTSMGDTDVFIVDVYKDKGSTGKNAAFTFMTSGVFMNHPMNDTDTNSGGWKSSGMRSWLNSSVLQAFPDELRSSVAPVNKKTNNVGRTTSVDSVGTTLDSVWLFSWVECLGPIAWNTGSEQSYIDDVDNQEGSQYAWFSQQGVEGGQGHPALHRAIAGSDEAAVWWMRSSAPNTSTSFGDMGPEIDNGGNASTAEGVVFGFCL